MHIKKSIAGLNTVLFAAIVMGVTWQIHGVQIPGKDTVRCAFTGESGEILPVFFGVNHPDVWGYYPNAQNDVKAEHGVEVVRVWLVWNESIDRANGNYTEASAQLAIRKLDSCFVELASLGMKAVACFKDFWGLLMGAEDGTLNPRYSMPEFWVDPVQKQQYKDYVSYCLNHGNHLTGRAWKDDPVIFAWELMNEPRDWTEGAVGVNSTKWFQEMALFIKSIDTNTMVVSGSENFFWESWDTNRENPFRMAEAPALDYVTHHFYNSLSQTNPNALYASEFFGFEPEAAVRASRSCRRPAVLEEYGWEQEDKNEKHRLVVSRVFTEAWVSGGGAGVMPWQYYASGPDAGSYHPIYLPKSWNAVRQAVNDVNKAFGNRPAIGLSSRICIYVPRLWNGTPVSAAGPTPDQVRRIYGALSVLGNLGVDADVTAEPAADWSRYDFALNVTDDDSRIPARVTIIRASDPAMFGVDITNAVPPAASAVAQVKTALEQAGYEGPWAVVETPAQPQRRWTVRAHLVKRENGSPVLIVRNTHREPIDAQIALEGFEPMERTITDALSGENIADFNGSTALTVALGGTSEEVPARSTRYFLVSGNPNTTARQPNAFMKQDNGMAGAKPVIYSLRGRRLPATVPSDIHTPATGVVMIRNEMTGRTSRLLRISRTTPEY